MTDSNIAGIAEADFGKAGVSFDNDRPILVDSSDFLWVKGQNVCLARRVAGVRFGLFECRLSGCSRCR